MRRTGLLVAIALLAPLSARAGGDRFVLAWPPTQYASAELVAWRDVAGGAPLRVRVQGRGIDRVVDVPAIEAARIPLPPEARCAPGLDACALTVTRVEGDASFSLLFQSPDTNGAADTLLLTAHDTMRIPPAAAAGTSWVAVSMPCAPAAEMPLGASFATITPASGSARVSAAPAGCLAAIDETIPEGFALTLTCTGEGGDVSGLRLASDAPIVVASGNAVTTVPVDPGRGLSGDLVLDLAGEPSGPALWAIPPLPRSLATAGLGDVVRIVALQDATVTIRDDRAGSTVLVLAAGETADVDTAGAGEDRAISLDASASIAAWQVPKSRARRGMGDPAAVPIVPSTRFTTSDRFFVPDGYAEAIVLVVVAEPAAAVLLDGVPLGLAPAPGVPLDMTRVSLPAAPAGGAVHELSGDAPFGAWIAAFGGYKACGHVAAASAGPRGVLLLRGTESSSLQPLLRVEGRSHDDPDASPRLFWAVDDDAAILRVRRCGASSCLTW